VDLKELWTRPLLAKGPNGGLTVGADCEAGGRGNMFLAAPERLRIKQVATAPVPGTTRTFNASRIVGGEGRAIPFANPPEFPQRITQRWLEAHVPSMPDTQYERLLAWLKLKRWTAADLKSRVSPFRSCP